MNLQGVTVRADYDVYAAAGNAAFKAVTFGFPPNESSETPSPVKLGRASFVVARPGQHDRRPDRGGRRVVRDGGRDDDGDRDAEAGRRRLRAGRSAPPS